MYGPLIIAYLFFGGTAAGAMLVMAWWSLRFYHKANRPTSRMARAFAAMQQRVYPIGFVLLLVSMLLVKGTLPEGGSFPMVAVLCVLSALAGGVAAVRLTRWKMGGLLTAAAFLSVLVLLGLGFWEEVAWLGHGGILLLCGLAGGLLAGAAGPRARRRHN